MDLCLSDKVALIAGSSRGIGFAIARAFLEEGAKAVITGRDGRALEAAHRQLAESYGPERVKAMAMSRPLAAGGRPVSHSTSSRRGASRPCIRRRNSSIFWELRNT